MKSSCRWQFLQGYGPDRSDIAGRLFAIFIEIFPPISVYSLSHLKCTMLGEGMENKNKNWGLSGRWKNQAAILGFLYPDCCLIYSYYFPILISLIQEQTVATLPGLPEGRSLVTRGHSAEVQWTSSTRAIIFIDFVAAALTWKSRGLSLDTHLGSGLLVWVSFEGSNFRREENSRKKLICL